MLVFFQYRRYFLDLHIDSKDHKINDIFYYSYIKILIDNTKICYCRKLDIFIKYDEDVNNPLYEADRATPGMGYYRYDEETDDFVEVKDFLKGDK